MSDLLRFNKARQVFEAFPTAAAAIEARPEGDQAPVAFLQTLVARAHRFDAVTYAAYLLPRREAVWWGCQCIRALEGGKSDEAFAAAEEWVKDSDDSLRRAALALWRTGDRRKATTWLARAAGLSGGNIAPEGAEPRLPPSHMTAVGVKCAVILAIAQAPASDQQAWISACVDAAIRLIEGGDAKVRPPEKAHAKPRSPRQSDQSP
jgi:hypothetical protein